MEQFFPKMLIRLCAALCTLAGALLAGGILLFVPPGEAGNDAQQAEIREIETAARHYLDAEVKGDHKRIYECLAPSSPYRANTSYEIYLKEVQASPTRIVSYRIVKVSKVRDNDDRRRFPNIEKFAQVEVELVILFEDVRKRTEANYDFPFIKENGKWFKG